MCSNCPHLARLTFRLGELSAEALLLSASFEAAAIPVRKIAEVIGEISNMDEDHGKVMLLSGPEDES